MEEKIISRDTLMAACRALGYDPENLSEIHIGPDQATVTTFERDETGARIMHEDRDGHVSYRKIVEHLMVVDFNLNG